MSFVFVTVGSTSFDNLIRTVNSEQISAVLTKHGYDRVLLQIGEKAQFTPVQNNFIQTEYFHKRKSIHSLLKKASLVICHAGVGTVMETLRLKTPVIVVANNSLMDNHQTELAEELARRNYIHYCPTEKTLLTTLLTELRQLEPYTETEKTLFSGLLSN